VYIIAEAGINHNGDLDTAFKLCDAAKEAGADCIKFQMYDMDNLFIPDILTTKYAELQVVLGKCMLDAEDFIKISDHCKTIGIDFAATPEDILDAKLLIELGVPYIKVGSRQALNFNYLHRLNELKHKVLMSTGLSCPSEERAAESLLIDTDYKKLFCVSKYPAPAEEYFERDDLRGWDGVSDHTVGIAVPIRLAGWIDYYERHLTLDCTQQGPDHHMSTEPETFELIVNAVREIE